MKQTINSYDFHRAFEQLRPDNFSYAGLNALFEYLEQYEEDTGQEIELDVIALCCKYTEYENIKEYNEAYDEECEDIEEIRDRTEVIDIDGERFIIQKY